MNKITEKVLLSPQEKRKARNQRYYAKRKLLPQEEQDAKKLKIKNATFSCQEDKENYNEKVSQYQMAKRANMSDEDLRAFKKHKSEQQAECYLKKKQEL